MTGSRAGVLAIQPRLAVADIAAASRFYIDVLGFQCNHQNPTNADGFVIVHRDGLGIQLVVARPDQSPSETTVWMQVGDAAAEHARFGSRATIEWGPEVYWYGSREFSVRDLDGHHLIFSSPTSDPPTCPAEEAG